MSDPCLKVSGGVEKHRGQGQGERKFKLRAPYLSVRDMREIQISYKFVFVVRQKVNPLFYRLPRPWLKERHRPSQAAKLRRGLIEKHKSETLRLPAMTLATRRPARSWRSRFSSAMTKARNPISKVSMRRRHASIQLSKQLTHLPGWCSGWPIELEPRITEI